MRAMGLTALVLLFAGCHTYEPAPPAPAFGTEVRARLTSPGALRLMDEVPTHEGRVVEGKLFRLTEAEVMLDIRLQTAFDPRTQREFIQRDTVVIPRDDVESMEARRLDGLRTGLLLVGGAAAVWGLVGSALGSGGGSDDPGDGGGDGTQNALLRLFRLPFP